MAEGGEKTQDPTPHRRQQARDEGNVAKSQDLGSAVLLLVGVVTMMTLGVDLARFLNGYARAQLGGDPWLTIDSTFAVAHWNGLVLQVARYFLPFLGVMLVTAILINLLQTGFLFLPSKIGFDLNRLNVLQAFGRIFSTTNVVRLGFGLFKILVIVVVAYLCVRKELPAIADLTQCELSVILVYLAQILLWTTLKIAIALVVLAILDYAFQFWKHEQDLKMTQQEMREEMRNMEGDPQVAQRRRVVQRQLVLNRLSGAVPKADVVVTNPTELAIAIQYDPKKMAAPIVVAKGAGVIAQRIRKLALEHGIPIVEKKPLARALFKEVDIGHPVPQERYAAVAEVLAYVYHLKGKKLETAPS
jgi:flagellar biosynthetic protein FlhB